MKGGFPRCTLEPMVLWSVSKGNFFGCKLDTAKKVDVKVKRNVVQRAVWFDKAAQPLATQWKPLLNYPDNSTAKLDLLPALEKIPGCGAELNCPRFEKIELPKAE